MSSRFDLQALRSRDELTAVGKDLADEVKTDDVPSMAAAVAFKIVLALFPSLVAAVGLFGLVTDPVDLQGLLDSLTGVVPAGVVEFISGPLNTLIENRAAGGIALVVGVAGGLWAASSAAVTLNKSLTRAYDEVETRKLVKMRGAALAVTFALLVALVGIFLLLIVGGRVENSILGSLPLTESARRLVDLASTGARYALAGLAAMLLFAFIYWIGPDFERRPRWVWITPGAVVGVLTFLIASTVFGIYTSWSGTYTGPNSIYGSLGSAILFMLWLQIAMLAVLLGAEVNQVLVRRARLRAAVPAPKVKHDRAQRSTGPASGVAPAAPAGSAVPAGAGNGTVWAVAPTPAAIRRGRDGVTSSGGERPVPPETLVGAGIAVVSSLVGLTGLVRRLRD